MRKLLLNIHLYIGLTAAVVMTILAITGTLLVFEPNIDHYLNAGMDHVQPGGIPISLDRLRDSLEQRYSGYVVTEIILPERPTSSTVFHLDSPTLRKSKELYVDQWTGKILGAGSQRNRLTKKVRLLHTQLLGGVIGNEVITWSTAGLAVLGVTGLVLWWPRKVFTVKRRSSLPRLNNDLHHSLGFWTSWTMLLFSATGLLIHASRTPDADPFGSTQTKIVDTHKRASISEILSSAQQTLPSGTLTRLDFSLDPTAPVSVTVRLPEDHTPLGRSSVKLDPSDGRVVQVSSTRRAPVRYKISKLWAREIHTGDIYGWPSRILAALCSFALALLALSGPMIWLNKKIAAQRGNRAAGVHRAQQATGSVICASSRLAEHSREHFPPGVVTERRNPPSLPLGTTRTGHEMKVFSLLIQSLFTLEVRNAHASNDDSWMDTIKRQKSTVMHFVRRLYVL